METDPSNRWCRITTRLCCFLLGFAALFPNARAAVWHVRKESSGPIPDGNSWASAHSSINAALTIAAPGDEIWVAAGDYRESIEVPDGVALFGGFQGTETAREQRRWMAHRSVIRTPPRIYEAGLIEPPGPLVRFGPSADPATRLDGFHLLGNRSDIAPAIYIPGGAPVVANNVIASHSADGVVASGAIAVDQSYSVPPMPPAEYFERTANWLFARHGLSIRTTNLMVWPDNQWTPEVQRLFQLAANLCDAAMPVPGSASPRFPRIFRPIIGRPDEELALRLIGFGEVSSAQDLPNLATQPDPWKAAASLAPGSSDPGLALAEAPWVVSVQPGWPSLTEAATLSVAEMVRTLEFWKSSPHQVSAALTNQIIRLGFSQFAALELSNTSSNDLDREIRIELFGETKNATTVHDTPIALLAHASHSAWGKTLVSTQWSGGAVILPLPTNAVLTTNLVYHWGQRRFGPLSSTNSRTASFRDTSLRSLNPQVAVSNRFTLAIVDVTSQRVVDFVRLPWFGNETNILPTSRSGLPAWPSAWDTSTNAQGTVSALPGIERQIAVAAGNLSPSYPYLDAVELLHSTTLLDWELEVSAISRFLGLSPISGFPPPNTSPPLLYIKAAPVAVMRNVTAFNLEPDDELLHRTVDELSRGARPTPLALTAIPHNAASKLSLASLNTLHPRLSLGQGLPTYVVPPHRFGDSLKRQSVPPPRFPAGGPIHFDWLTRVHRGSPLQTVLLAPTWFSRTNRDDALAFGLLQGELGVPLLPEPPARPVIVHNTFVGNDRSALWLHPSAQPVVINNLFATNSAGIDVGGQGSQALVAVNGFWNNASSVTGSPAPFSQPVPLANPAFFAKTAADARLQAVSPARDAGSFLPLDNGWVLAEPSRWQGAAPDLGAHEVSEEDPPLLTLAAPNPPAPGQPSTPWSLDATLLAPGGAVLEASTNLVEWWPVATNTPVAGAIHWTLPEEETSALFFRVLRP